MIVFSMAGLSRRFSEAGYDRPKYMLPLGDATCFDHAVAGFREAYRGETFAFVMRDVAGTPAFVEQRLDALGVANRALVVLGTPTSGQGETVAKGLAALSVSDDEEITIFNIDTFRLNVTKPSPGERGDGYLEVFVGSGDNWSFVEPAPGADRKVARTTEKEPVSDLCCTGLYHFHCAADFVWALDSEARNPTSPLKESYVAPIYNQLIRAGRDIRYVAVPRDDVILCGVPAEYEELHRADSIIGRDLSALLLPS